MTVAAVDRAALEQKVKGMYSDVAVNPHGDFHFEMGRAMAERLGYAAADLDGIPHEAIESLAVSGISFTSPTCCPATRSSISAAARESTASSRHFMSDRRGGWSAWT